MKDFLVLQQCQFDDHLNKEYDLLSLENELKAPDSLREITGLPDDIVEAAVIASNDTFYSDHRSTPSEEKLTPHELGRDWFHPVKGLWILYRDKHRYFVLEMVASKMKYREIARKEALEKHGSASRQMLRIVGPEHPALKRDRSRAPVS